ncbi:hypothetical protein MPY17_27140 [Rhodococcus opacus]|uniref:hypothetical protein n=1 Tax=Rhodococcus opacus TaxID=37919 RepID=UPI001FF163A3|nr:hypothetical protein [Rhodococcus opacus]UOT02616.1 hypothetical protein MPY17_27140 [Rhodococcus opacus]
MTVQQPVPSSHRGPSRGARIRTASRVSTSVSATFSASWDGTSDVACGKSTFTTWPRLRGTSSGLFSVASIHTSPCCPGVRTVPVLGPPPRAWNHGVSASPLRSTSVRPSPFTCSDVIVAGCEPVFVSRSS